MIEYDAKGTCSKKIRFDLKDGKVYSVSFDGGCDGSLKAVSMLVDGSDAGELIKKLKGLRCGRKETSCADQLASAVAGALAGKIGGNSAGMAERPA